jgi:hypothetical protein
MPLHDFHIVCPTDLSSRIRSRTLAAASPTNTGFRYFVVHTSAGGFRIRRARRVGILPFLELNSRRCELKPSSSDRIDIEFVTTGRGKRPRFLIEAKRLYRSNSVNEYFAAGGLQMFVQGHYSSEWPSAGMLGYVQSATCVTWLELGRLAAGFADRRTEIGCEESSGWEPAALGGQGLEDVKVSRHQRTPQHLSQVEIFHLLLDFA